MNPASEPDRSTLTRERKMLYRWLALAVSGLHFGYLAYLVAGGYLAWRWPRTVVLHLFAVTWGALAITTRTPCPLTGLQNALRARGGQRELDGTFVDTYVRGAFYPADHETAARGVVALVIAVSWLGLAARWAHPTRRRDLRRLAGR